MEEGAYLKLEGVAKESAVSGGGIAQWIVYFVLVAFFIALAVFVYYDRRQGYVYLIAFKKKVSEWWAKGRAMFGRLKKKMSLGQKVSGQEQPNSSKATLGVLETEKTFQQADLNSIQQTANTTPAGSDQFRNMSVEDETPQVNLKEVFQMQRKGKSKDQKKSKSKLRNRILIKKSEIEAEAHEEQNSCDISQDVEKSVDEVEV